MQEGKTLGQYVFSYLGNSLVCFEVICLEPLSVNDVFRDGRFDIQGGGWDFFEKNNLFPMRCEKNKMSSTKLKINSFFFIQ